MIAGFSKTNPRSIQPPVYISREQFQDAYYIPSDANIIIVDFKEEEDETNSNRENDDNSKSSTYFA